MRALLFSAAIPIKVRPEHGHVDFVEVNKMVTEIKATSELNPQLITLATEIGLNVQKICENALKQAIG